MMTPIDKDAVLDAFAAEPVHDRSTLERYVSEYPELAEELIDLAAELRLSAEFAGAEEGVISDPKLDTAWENFLAAVGGDCREASITGGVSATEWAVCAVVPSAAAPTASPSRPGTAHS